jgi:hypothetical protein
MGDTLEKKLDVTTPGDLNLTKHKRFSPKLSKYSAGAITQLKQARDEVFKENASVPFKDEYHAICLYADNSPVGEVPLIDDVMLGGNTDIIRVIARIPELHASIPKPLISGETGVGCPQLRNQAILMHPVFYSSGGGQKTIPEPGNIVKVRFPNITVDRSFGEYLGVVDHSSVVVVDNPPASEAFDNKPTQTVKEAKEQHLQKVADQNAAADAADAAEAEARNE